MAAVIGRFAVSPLLVVWFFPVPDIMRKVFVVQAGMPSMMLIAIISKLHGADAEYATLLTAVTTVGAVAVIPAYMLLLG